MKIVKRFEKLSMWILEDRKYYRIVYVDVKNCKSCDYLVDNYRLKGNRYGFSKDNYCVVKNNDGRVVDYLVCKYGWNELCRVRRE